MHCGRATAMPGCCSDPARACGVKFLPPQPSCTARAQALGRGSKNVPSFIFLVQADVNFGQPGPHGDVFRIHFQRLLEDPYCLLQFTGAQEFFGDLQVLGPGIVEQSLLRVELSQPQHAFQRGLELGKLLVHRDALLR